VADETRLIFGSNCFRWLLVIFLVIISVDATENKKIIKNYPTLFLTATHRQPEILLP
jgi:hypothetical protein